MSFKSKTDAYLHAFEQGVIAHGFRTRALGEIKEGIVPLRAGKFGGTELERTLGKDFQCDDILGVDFYGYFKLSSGILQVVRKSERIFPGIRSIKAPIVHFNSITASQVAQLYPELVAGFDDFKQWVARLRFNSDCC